MSIFPTTISDDSLMASRVKHLSSLHRLACASVISICITLASPVAFASDHLQLERVVLLYRHGVRSPLPGEIQLDEVNGKPWPTWSQAPSELTGHGISGAIQMGRYDRQRLAALKLFPAKGCPEASSLWFWANTDQRTIASAQALAQGFAPDCPISIGHQAPGSEDPLFHPIEAGSVGWSAHDAVASIHAQTGGPNALTASHADDLAAMAQVMGCNANTTQPLCDANTWRGNLAVSPDQKQIVLTGPIATTSGTAEAMLMAYAEGKPLSDVGWGRADASRLEQLSRLHSLLFDIYARPDYMAQRVAAVMSKHLVSTLQDPQAPRLYVLVGSDNNIVALASVLGIHFKMPGYGQDDPPIGGALGMEVWRDAADHRFVRVFYQAQTLTQLRMLEPIDRRHPPATLMLNPAGCVSDKRGLCPLEHVLSRLEKAAAQVK